METNQRSGLGWWRFAPPASVAARSPKRRPRPLIRSAGIRFALIYAVVFGVSAFLLAFSLWYSTVGLLQRQVEISIRNDSIALDEHFTAGGLPSLVTAIHDRMTDALDA